jgi:hypothetical protein
MVVVEIGTGTWCPYCPGAAMGADELVENGHRAAIVENHNGDNYANTYSNARNTYYNIGSFPTAYFDGMNATVGGSNTVSSYPGYRTKVNARLNVESQYTITATGTHSGTTYNVAVTVTKVGTDTNTNLKLHGVLTESGIQQSWQGQTHLSFVNRLMAPSANGTDIDFSTNNTQTVNLTFNASSAWNSNNFEFVFFLQNNSSKEILQGCKYSIMALENVYPLNVQTIDFGNVQLDNIYDTQFTLSNWWSQDMNISLSVNNPDIFVYQQQTTREDYFIPFMTAMSFDVIYLPSQPGVTNAMITISTDNPAYPTLQIPVTANVVTAASDQALPSPVSHITGLAPNPFRNSVEIRYILKRGTTAELGIYDIKGKKVHSQSITGSESEQSIIWNGMQPGGKSSQAGVYLCRITDSNGRSSVKKLIRLD